MNFIEKAKQVHGDKYDYSKANYINSKTKICIICPKHGEFWQTPNAHLNGQGCPTCNGKFKYTTEEFIEKAKQVHGDKYDYMHLDYVNSSTKVCIICPEHGEFWQTPNKHLLNRGCPICAKENKKLSTEEFIEKARKVHGDKYDYSKVLYESSETPVCIICLKHGEFWQTPHTHLKGYGCNKCSESYLENKVRVMLEKNNIKYEYRKHFNWLGRQELDFYISDYNTGIECQGEEHYRPVDFFGGLKSFNKIKNNDYKKSKKCKENNVKLLYFSEEKHKLFNGIKSYINDEILKELQII